MSSHAPQPRLVRRVHLVGCCCAAALLSLAPSSSHGADPPVVVSESLSDWQYWCEIQPGEAVSDGALYDVLLTNDVYSGARLDLTDLRIRDALGREVPFALRVRNSVDSFEAFAAEEFNRASSDDGWQETSLDLGEAAVEHNEVEMQLSGAEYRRRAEVHGSDDRQQWQLLGSNTLLHFERGKHNVDDRRVAYPASRFRYLKVRVLRDPDVDKEPFEIRGVTVQRRVEVPGEYVTQDVRIGLREADRTDRQPASNWILDLGGDYVPCEKLLVDVADAQFARDYQIEAAGPPDSAEPFHPIHFGQWRRRPDEPVAPLEASFGEVRISRLRLSVIDSRNPPLEIKSVRSVAPVRQIVLAQDRSLQGPLRLYFGNLKAQPAQYDFARNLPARLATDPVRLPLSARVTNPDYHVVIPLSERWPWAIYVVLTGACVILGLLLANLAQHAIALHDAEHAAPAEA